MKEFGLSDDLYIKMNARGKQLTMFENFKADLIGFIQGQAESEQDNSKWKRLSNEANGIAIKWIPHGLTYFGETDLNQSE